MNKKILKLMSLILAVLSLSSSLNVALYAVNEPNIKSENATVSSKNNENGTWDKVKDNVKKNVALYSVGTAATVTTIVSLLMNKRSQNRYNSLLENYNNLQNHHNLLEVIVNPAPEVPADVWFERLGGTQNDINSYKIYELPKRGHLTDREKQNIDQINLDVNRYPPEASRSENQIDEFKVVFNRILDKYHIEHEDVNYAQSWDDILYMIYRKFMIDRDTYEPLSKDDEAKVYFIYSKFMEMIGRKYNNSDLQHDSDVLANKFFGNFNNYNREFRHATLDLFESSICRSNLFLKGAYSGGPRILGFERATKIWDYIITNNQFISPEGGFNQDENNGAFVTVSNIIYSYVDLNFDNLKRDLFPYISAIN